MSNYRTFALGVILAGAFAASAAAQDCDRYAYGCRGAPGYAPPQPGYAPPYQGYPAYQGYPGYQPYPAYQQPYQPYAAPPPPYAAPGPYGPPGPYAPGYGPRPSAYPPAEEEQPPPSPARPSEGAVNPAYRSDPALARRFAALYGPVSGEPHALATVRPSDIDPAFMRATVSYPSGEAPGTVIIDPQNHYLYLIQAGGQAIRYGVGVGRQGFGWSGTANIHDKQEWPDWYPPKEMLARQPDLMRHMSELQGG
ncbi:MAG TPA: L,D-transpeptidase, partial [Xanthobacteraceae bacterium]|nr:L,D-transpeptidase [Xanthobacteraceae bacterium]